MKLAAAYVSFILILIVVDRVGRELLGGGYFDRNAFCSLQKSP